jgi:hypothetical protein
MKFLKLRDNMLDITTESLEHIKQTLNLQEAKVIMLMRECPYQTITVVMENGKVVHKKQLKPIED